MQQRCLPCVSTNTLGWSLHGRDAAAVHLMGWLLQCIQCGSSHQADASHVGNLLARKRCFCWHQAHKQAAWPTPRWQPARERSLHRMLCCVPSVFNKYKSMNQMGGNLLASQSRVAIPRKLWQSGTYTLLLWSFHKKEPIWSFHKRSRSGASTALKEALRAFTKGADLDLPQKEPIGSFCCGSFCGWADLDPKAADVEPPQKEPIWSPMRHDRPHAP